MKIIGIGRNYALHNQEMERLRAGDQRSEMGSSAEMGERSASMGVANRPEVPVVFLKPDSALQKPGKPFFVPDHLGRIDYEAELVVRICRLGKNIPERFAHRYYDAVTVGLDFTARDLQLQAQQAGLPWTICKGFDGAAVIGESLPLPLPRRGKGGGLKVEGGGRIDSTAELSSLHIPPSTLHQVHFRLEKNGVTVQEGCSDDMLFSVDELISYVSRFFTLKTGDLIFTGTPAGVGPVSIGDHLTGWIEDQKVLNVKVR